MSNVRPRHTTTCGIVADDSACEVGELANSDGVQAAGRDVVRR